MTVGEQQWSEASSRAMGKVEMPAEPRSTCAICSSPCQATRYSLGGFALHWCEKCDFYFAPEAFSALPDYDEAYSLPAYLRNQVEAIRGAKDASCFAQIPTYRVFFENTPLAERRSLLDVGCGVGRFCHAAHAHGWDVMGSNPSATAIQIGAPLASFPLVCQSLADLAKTGRRFDQITAFEVVEHVPAPRELVRQIRSLLSEHGAFFFTVPNWNCPLVHQATNYDAVPPFHINFFTQRACATLLEAAGFTSVRTGVILVDPLPTNPRHFPSWLLRRIMRKPRNLGLWAAGVSPP